MAVFPAIACVNWKKHGVDGLLFGADLLRELVDLLHALEDGLVHLAHPGTGACTIAHNRIGQRNSDVGALVAGQLVGTRVEIDACHGFGSIDSLAHLN